MRSLQIPAIFLLIMKFCTYILECRWITEQNSTITMQNKRARSQVLEELRHKLGELESSFRPSAGAADVALPCGVGPLNALLPSGGLRSGTVVEWLTEAEGAGAAMLGFVSVLPWLGEDRACVIVDEKQEFYPAFLSALGIDLEQVLLVRPTPKDVWWALEQALRCRGVAVTVGWLGPVPNRIAQRLQMAAEAGGGLGVFFRPASVRAEPTWCHTRLLVQAVARGIDFQSVPTRRARIEVLYCKGGASGASVEVEIHEETGAVHLAAPLVPARDARQAT